MSGSASNPNEQEAFVETDDKATRFTYDKGGVPLYVALIWITFLVCYVVYMVKYALPDFTLWLEM